MVDSFILKHPKFVTDMVDLEAGTRIADISISGTGTLPVMPQYPTGT